MSTLALSNHARQRVIEFGIGLDVVAEIASRPDVTHRNASGEVVCTADRHPDWTVVLGHGDVVVTVLRRLPTRWEHGPAAPVRDARVSDRGTAHAATSPARPALMPSAAVEDVRELASPPTPAPDRRRSAAAAQRPSPSAVVVRAVDPDALRRAREIADGDARRLVLNDDGSVTILNRPRSSR